MRYWGILVAKLAVAAAGLYAYLDRPEGQLYPSLRNCPLESLAVSCMI